MSNMAECSTNVYFDPDVHPDNTLKAFSDFAKRFELRYEAAYPDPPKTSIDAALSRWKVINAEKEFNVEEYDAIVESWRGKDMVKKCETVTGS